MDATPATATRHPRAVWIAPFVLAAAWLLQAPLLHDRADSKLAALTMGLLLGWALGLRAMGGRQARHGWPSQLVVAATAGAGVSLGMAGFEAVDGFVDGWMGRAATPAVPPAPLALSAAELLSGRVAAWAGLTLLLWAILAAQDRQRRLADQRGELLRDARDAALRAKLAPHFLFNTLNTLKAQVESDPRGAADTADMLAALFRQVLELSDRPTVPLKDELAFVEAYLGIERKRLGKRLRVKVEVPEEVEGVEVPALALQALVENAVKHGIAPREEGGELRIWARWDGPGSGRKLVVGVENPVGPGGAVGTGTGLEALRGRLARPGDLTTAARDGRFEASFVWGGGRA